MSVLRSPPRFVLTTLMRAWLARVVHSARDLPAAPRCWLP